MIHTLTISVVILTGVIAGCIDTIAGGGGMLTVPVLLMLGLNPATALGTNRFQSILGESMATWRFIKAKQVKLSALKRGIIFTLVGSGAGTVLVQWLHPQHLQKIIPVLMLLVLIYTLIPNKVRQHRKSKLRGPVFFSLFGLLIGFYNGFFGPSTGTFWIVALMFFLAFPIQQAVTHAKPLNLTGNIISCIVFMAGGHVAFILGLIMGLGQLVGAYIGAHLVVKKGASFIRPIFMAVVFVLTIILFYKYW